MTELTSVQRQALRARAHALRPVVAIAGNGLGAGVIAELERSLQAHELIKVRVQGAERARREALLAEICEALDAAPVQHIGNILIVWRPRKAKPEAKKAAAAPRNMATAKSAAPFAAAAHRAALAKAAARQKRGGGGRAHRNQSR
ncbi:MAG: YhbY family RNA-binding protein [Azoarcus sp.]|nr:YhbY family RNA-binding protein [Azoarcus sp.]